MATRLTQYGSSPTSITAHVSGWPSGTGYIRFYIGTTTSDMPYDGYVTISSQASISYTFAGLQPGTPYYVKISPRAATSGQEAIESATTVLMYTEEAPQVRPQNWSWSSNIYKGAAISYTKNGNTITCKPLRASEWNLFIDTVFEFLAYKGKSVSVAATSLYVSQGARMTAAAVDEVRDLIALMNPPTALPAAASSGSGITAAYFNGLKNSLNSIS